MNTFHRVLDRPVRSDLVRMIEPLANYICATEQPRTALMSALAVLFSEVEATNRAAVVQSRTYLEN
jgi:hypothetical protein